MDSIVHYFGINNFIAPYLGSSNYEVTHACLDDVSYRKNDPRLTQYLLTYILEITVHTILLYFIPKEFVKNIHLYIRKRDFFLIFDNGLRKQYI